MSKVIFGKPLEVPEVWKDLLKISFDELGKYPGKARYAGKPIETNNPKPFRDDERVVSISEGEYAIDLFLVSGNNNYWAHYSVGKDGQGIEDYIDDNIKHDIREGSDEILLPDGTKLVFAVKIDPKIDKAQEPEPPAGPER